MQASRLVRRALDGLYLGAGWLAGLFLIAILVLMLSLSAGRLVGLNIASGDDFTAWCMAACAFLGLAHTFKVGDMIRVRLLIDRVSGPPRRIIEIVVLAVGAAFVVFFAFQACVLVRDSWRFMDMSQGVIAVPLWIPQLGYAAGLVVLAIAFVDELVHVLTGHEPRYEKAKPESAEELLRRVEAGEI